MEPKMTNNTKTSPNNQITESNKEKSDSNIPNHNDTSNHNNKIIMENLQINLSKGNSKENQNDPGLKAENMIFNIDESSGKRSITNKITPPHDNDNNHSNEASHEDNDKISGKKYTNPVCIIELNEETKKKPNKKYKEVAIGNRNINPRQKKALNPISSSSWFMSSESSGDTLMFFFIDKNAGEGKGRNLLNMGVKKIEFASDLKVIAYLFDIDDLQGVETLKTELNRASLIKVIIGGGDDSILPFIENLNSSDIDLNRLIFGIIPLGRTNDISRQFRWGGYTEISSDMADFKKLVKQINQSPSVIVDLWDIKLTCDEHNGAIITCHPNTQEKLPQKDDKNKKRTIFRKGFVGYLSLGYDARIGFNANKKRSDCKCWNDTMVVWEKFKKSFFRKTISISGFIESLSVISIPKEGSTHNISNSDMTFRENENRKTKIFQSPNKDGIIPNRGKEENNNDFEDSDEDEQSSNPLSAFRLNEIVLKGQPLGIVCQNIEYFFNGNPTSWKQTKNEYGLETFDPKISKDDKVAIEKKLKNDIEMFNNAFGNSSQCFSDRKLEFYTYNSVIDIGNSQKDKIYHGEGPFLLKFKPTPFHVSIYLIIISI